MSTHKSPLEKLLVDPKEICEELLLGLLEEYVCLEKSSGDVIFKPAFSGLTQKAKVLMFLAARKAAKLLNLSNEEHISSDCISKAIGIEPKTISEILSRLKSQKIVDSKDGWYIPDKNLILLPEYFNRFLKTE